MKTGTKIALFYSAITVGVIALIIFLFYWMATGYMDRLYYSYLTEKAFATAAKHWEKDESTEEDYARIQKHYDETLPVATEILLNADQDKSTRDSLSVYLSEYELDRLYAGETIRIHKDDLSGAAVYYPDNEGNFIVLVLSTNKYGIEIQHRIAWLLLGLLLISAVLIYFVGRLYATRMIDRIDAAYQSEKSFISNASHELNNPLTAIQGECEISLMKERSPQEYQAALKRIETETKRIIQLMKNLLFLSRGDKEILTNAREEIALADFLMQFVDGRVSFQTDHFAYTITANPHLLKIALGNLINNACKYSENKPVEIRMKAGTLTITDYGIGIPSEELPHIFQPFYRASNARSFSGHGIGLSLSLRILGSYGAQVEVVSEPKKGTCVSVDFP